MSRSAYKMRGLLLYCLLSLAGHAAAESESGTPVAAEPLQAAEPQQTAEPKLAAEPQQTAEPQQQQQPAQERQACLMPKAPSILDGRTARKEQITEMRQAVVAFIGDNHAYRKCLEQELKLLEGLKSQKARDLRAYIDEALLDSLDMDELVADTFNTQLRIYKSLRD